MLHLISSLPFLASAQAFFILSQPVLLTTRLDPIVNPGEISGHVHSIAGGSNFDKTMTYESSQAGGCTTAPITVDHSNYWIPQLYYYNPVTTGYQAIPAAYVNTYYLNRYGANDTIKAFPDGLRMISGDPFRRTFEADSVDNQAITFVCLDYAGGHEGDPAWDQRNNFFEHNCPGGMRAQVNFPTCWDGVNLDSPNHKSHVAWPTNGNNNGGGDCPASHPVKMVELFYEFIFEVQNFPFNAPGTPTWVFANGDATGYGLHADFINGWPTLINGSNVLQRAIDECDDNLGVGGNLGDCPPFAGLINNQQSAGCQPQNELVNEDIGWGHEIPFLPGDNPLWTGNGSKPTDPNYVEGNTTYTDFKSILPPNWEYVGCIAEASSGRALADYFTSSKNMSRTNCAIACEAQGFPLSGSQYGQECYCGLSMENSSSNTKLLDESSCNIRCSGNLYENCGGSRTLNLYVNNLLFPAPVAPVTEDSAANPKVAAGVDGWSKKQNNCVREPTTGRALTGFTLSNGQMSGAACMQACQTRGYTYAGTEYGTECFCGTEVTAGAVEAPADECTIACSGASGEICGGPSHLSFYSFDPSAVTGETTLPSGWVANGCFNSAATSGKAFAGSVTSSDSMTNDICMQTCQSQGYALAGIEYGRECRCAPAFSPGSTTTASPTSECDFSCSGSPFQLCGGSNRMTTFKYTGTLTPPPSSSSTAGSPTASSVSGTWTYSGCYTETVGARAVNGGYLQGDDMTREKCEAFAKENGHTWASLVYGRECFTGTSLSDSSVLTADSECSFECMGSSAEECGAGDRASVLQFVADGASPIVRVTSTTTPAAASSTSAAVSISSTSVAVPISDTPTPSSSTSDAPVIASSSSTVPVSSESVASAPVSSAVEVSSSSIAEAVSSSSEAVTSAAASSVASASAVAATSAEVSGAAPAEASASAIRRSMMGMMRRRGERNE